MKKRTEMSGPLRNPLKDADRSNVVFIIGMAVCILFFILGTLLTRGGLPASALYHNAADPSYDTFMDYFNSLTWDAQAYQNGQIYPPLATVCFWLLGKMLPQDALNAYQFPDNRYVLRDSPLGLMEYLIFLLVCLLLFSAFFRQTVGGSTRKRESSTAVVLLSFPFFYLYERGNLLILPLALSMVFLWGYSSKSRFRRLISYFSLSLAAAIKIYPAILGLLLVRKRRWKDAALLAVMGLLVFMLPFFAFDGGLKNLLRMFSNLSGFSEHLSNLFIRFDLSTVLNLPAYCFHWSLRFSGGILSCFLVPCVAALVILHPEIAHWKAVAMLSALMIMVPNVSYPYTLTLMALPLALFLSKEALPEERKWNCIYSVFFLLIFMPFAIPAENDSLLLLYLPTFLKCVGLYGLFLTLVFQVLYHAKLQNPDRWKISVSHRTGKSGNGKA